MTLGDGINWFRSKRRIRSLCFCNWFKKNHCIHASQYLDEAVRSIAFNDLHGEVSNGGEGDTIIKALIILKILAQALANFTAFSQPEAFVLMGGLVNSGKWILEPLDKYLNESLLKVYRGVKILNRAWVKQAIWWCCLDLGKIG